MLLYRLAHARYARDLSGEGARINGGRWNHPDTACIYSSGTRALALLEYTAHVKAHLIPRSLAFITLEVPENSIKIYTTAQLPGNWKESPAPKETRDFGTRLLKGNKYLIYRIPSVVIDDEMNFLINPAHPLMKQVKIKEVKDYSFDIRLKTN